jgi:hypothetical protein
MTLSMLNVWKQVALCHAVASQLVGHHHPRHIARTLQQAPDEARGGFGVAASWTRMSSTTLC